MASKGERSSITENSVSSSISCVLAIIVTVPNGCTLLPSKLKRRGEGGFMVDYYIKSVNYLEGFSRKDVGYASSIDKDPQECYSGEL